MAKSEVEGATKSVTLTFTTQAELDLFGALKADAVEDERTLSKFIVRLLKASYDDVVSAA